MGDCIQQSGVVQIIKNINYAVNGQNKVVGLAIGSYSSLRNLVNNVHGRHFISYKTSAF